MRSIVLAFILQIMMMPVSAQQSPATYTNPILSGFYPDPSICRVNDDYYLVTSSFAYYPGLPVFHSKDLVSWKQLGYALDRPEQLDLDGAGVSRGLFAPAITFHNGLFYITCTLVDKGGNFIITAKDPKGPWSNPTWIPEIDGIDPSLFFDDNGKAYIIYNSVAPDNKALYEGHRTLRMYELDIASLKVKGQEKLIINGGTDLSKKPIWIEAPHIFKKDGWYYLIAAEGGTSYEHSEVVFRSKTLDGPFIPYERNPILTQRHLDRNRKNPITSTGHADFVETPDGKWYAVFLGCRPYEGAHYNTGRETFMAPVTWENGWPIINKGFEEVQYRYPLPQPQVASKANNLFSGNVHFRDEFTQPMLNPRYTFLRTVRTSWHGIDPKKGRLAMQVRPETCTGTGNPSFIANRQHNLSGEASTQLSFNPAAPDEKAGLLAFQSEHHFYYLCKSVDNGKPVVQLYKSTPTDTMQLIASAAVPADKPLQLKIEARRTTYAFYYASGKDWITLKEDVDAKFLSTATAGGFVGCVFAMYATSMGKPSNSVAYFDWFDYKGKDPIY